MKISIIVPVYNAAQTIQRAIKSIDTKHDHEIICINDGSTDNSQQVLEQLRKEYSNMVIVNQTNKGAAASRNKGLELITGDVFMFLDADDEFLTSRIDYMADYYLSDENVDIVLGQLARDVYGTWTAIPTHRDIQKEDKVNFSQCPAILQSIGPGAKMFNARFAGERFNEDIVFCEEHEFMVQLYKKARDIQLLPDVVYGYNEQIDSVTYNRQQHFDAYMKDAIQVRSSVMDQLHLREARLYYSYRMDELIVSYLIQAYLTEHEKLTQATLNTVINYINEMQKTDYDGDAMFRIVKVVEQSTKNWNKALYDQWRSTLISVGIGRPKYVLFKANALPKRAKYKGETTLKKYLRK